MPRVDHEHEYILQSLNLTHQAVVVTDAAERVTWLNDAFTRMCGHRADALVGQRLGPILQGPATDRGEVARIRDSVTAGRPIVSELVNYRADRTPYRVSLCISPVPDAGGRPVRFVAFACDVSTRHQETHRLGEQARFHAALLAAAPDVVMVVDADGIIRYESRAIERVLGWTPEERLGRCMHDYVHPEDAEHLRALLGQAAREPGVLRPVTFRARHRNGEWRTFEATGRSAHRDPALGGFVVSSRDVTDRAALEEEVHRARQQAAVGRLAGGIAHEFNNLLAAIVGFTDLALMRPGAEQTFPELHEIQRAAGRAAELTRQLLAFGRRQPLHPERVDPNAVVAAVATDLASLAGERIRVATTLAPALTPVRVDPHRLRQVLTDLALNARDATPDGGVVELRTSHVTVAERPDPAHAGVPAGDYALVEIRDAGAGMDGPTRERAAEPFFTTREVGSGAGLGLSAAYGTIAQSGGFLTLQSDPGVGTTCRVYLPCAAAERGDGAPGPPVD